MVRTQLYLDEETHARLKRLGRRQGRSLSQLVREALARAYAPARDTQRLVTLQAIGGLWRDRADLGTTRAYVRRLRRDTRRRRATR